MNQVQSAVVLWIIITGVVTSLIWVDGIKKGDINLHPFNGKYKCEKLRGGGISQLIEQSEEKHA